MTSIANSINSFMAVVGTGDPVQDSVVITAILTVVAFAVGCFALYRLQSFKPELPPGVERLPNLLAKLDRLERDMGDLRAELQRPLELLRNELLELKGGTPSIAPVTAEKKTELLTPQNQNVVVVEGATTTSVPVSNYPQPLTERLQKSRRGFFGSLRRLLTGKAAIDPAALEELEALLISSDLGVHSVERLMKAVKAAHDQGQAIGEQELSTLCREQILQLLERTDPARLPLLAAPKRSSDGPVVVLMVGVNGVGKTTTSAKLAARWHGAGAKVLLVAADTFRAAAVEQLRLWGERVGVPVQTGASDAKPATVVYDAMVRAQKEEFDVVVIDTAGRLHTKANLMQELEGVYNSIRKHQASAPHETLLVLDGSTGQNAVSQAKEFNAAVPLTGLVVTKLDGTPKGGIVVAIADELGVPVQFIGVGEAAEDLRPFVAQDFVAALFDQRDLEVEDGAGSSKVAELSAHGAVRRRRREGSEVVGTK